MVAREVGIGAGGMQVVTGTELDAMTECQLDTLILAIDLGTDILVMTGFYLTLRQPAGIRGPGGAGVMAGLLAVFLHGGSAGRAGRRAVVLCAGLRVEHAQELPGIRYPRCCSPKPRLRATTVMSRRCMPGEPLPTERSIVATFPPRLVPQLTPPAVGVLLLGAWMIAHRMLQRRRLDAWDADWRMTAPRWTSRR